MTTNVKGAVEQRSKTFYETHIACRLAGLQSELLITHANAPTAQSHLNIVIF